MPEGRDESENLLVWVDPDGGEEQIPLEPAAYHSPQLSPDGTRLAYSIVDPVNQDVWVADLRRPGARTRVTTEASIDSTPNWTSDGEHLVFQSGHIGRYDLLRRAADGTGAAEVLVSSGGDRFLHPSDSARNGELMFVAVGSKTTSTDIPALSPDGGWLAYDSDESGQAEVYVTRFPSLGDRQVVSVGGGIVPTWSSDGTRIFYQSGTGMMAASVTNDGSGLTLGTPALLFDGPYRASRDGAYDLAPDGRFLMMKPADPTAGNMRPKIHIVLNWLKELKERVPVR